MFNSLNCILCRHGDDISSNSDLSDKAIKTIKGSPLRCIIITCLVLSNNFKMRAILYFICTRGIIYIFHTFSFCLESNTHFSKSNNFIKLLKNSDCSTEDYFKTVLFHLVVFILCSTRWLCSLSYPTL